MPALICGSLAFDTITTFPGRFSQQILPEQLHILNVSFLVPELRREFGGCAGNIAYNLRQLGGEPVVMAAIGNDGGDYLERIRSWGVDTSMVTWVDDHYTAQAIIITDTDNNQITAFHPGAMQKAGEVKVPARADLKVAIIAPDGRDAMLSHARQLHAADIPFVFDPGQGLPMFDGAELRDFIAQARWVAVNDYEVGAQGCDIWVQGHKEHVPGIAAQAVLDPTGCGDAFRGALLYGLERGWTLQRCVALGNRLGAAKIACRGGQNHHVDPAWALG